MTVRHVGGRENWTPLNMPAERVELSDRVTGARQFFSVQPHGLLRGGRKTRRATRGRVTGHYPFTLPATGRRTTVRFESVLQLDFLQWIEKCPGLAEVVARPMEVWGRIEGRHKKYTPAYMTRFTTLPAYLAVAGFAERTYVEMKPEELAGAAEVLLQAHMLHRATGLPVILTSGFPSAYNSDCLLLFAH